MAVATLAALRHATPIVDSALSYRDIDNRIAAPLRRRTLTWRLVAVLVLKVSLLGLFQCVAATAFAGALAYGAVYLRGHWVAEGRAHDKDAPGESEKPEPPAPEATDEADEAVGEARP